MGDYKIQQSLERAVYPNALENKFPKAQLENVQEELYRTQKKDIPGVAHYYYDEMTALDQLSGMPTSLKTKRH